MRGNKGYSLIELVVVIALLAILGAVIGGSIMSINSSEASKCANNINSLATKCKVNSMSRAADVAVAIHFDGNHFIGDYYEDDNVMSTDVLGTRRMSVSYTTSASDTPVLLDDGTAVLYIAFDRSTGALKSLAEAECVAGASGADDDVYLKTIDISVNSRVITIEFVQPTGKHSIR